MSTDNRRLRCQQHILVVFFNKYHNINSYRLEALLGCSNTQQLHILILKYNNALVVQGVPSDEKYIILIINLFENRDK